ncbi:uncharacterized protein [Cherax quadricarinatus]
MGNIQSHLRCSVKSVDLYEPTVDSTVATYVPHLPCTVEKSVELLITKPSGSYTPPLTSQIENMALNFTTEADKNQKITNSSPCGPIEASGSHQTPSSSLPVSTKASGSHQTPSSSLPASTKASGSHQFPNSSLPASTKASGSCQTPSSSLPASTKASGSHQTPSSSFLASTKASEGHQTTSSSLPASTKASGSCQTPSSSLPASTKASGSHQTPSSSLPPATKADESHETPLSLLFTSVTAGESNCIPSVPAQDGLTCPSQTNCGPLTTEDENVLKYFAMLRRTGPAASVMAKVSRRLYGGGQQSVKDFYTSTLGFNNSQYRKVFSHHEREAFEANVDWETLDITCTYKLLQHVCGLAPISDAKWSNPEPQDVEGLEHILFSVKGERNFLAHEAVVLTCEGFQTRSEKLELLLEKALKKTSCITGEDYNEDIRIMKETINDIKKSKTKLSLQNYQKELQDFLHDLVSKIIINSQSELGKIYRELWQEDSVWWQFGNSSQSPRLEQIFTTLTIMTKNSCVVPVLEILEHKLPNGSLPRLVILEGIAGMGKSHICKYILNCWASRSSNMNAVVSSIDILIYIQCYSVASSSLNEFLREEILKETCKGLRHEDVICTLRECRLLFIIDGLDEAGIQAKYIIREVNAKFPASRVMLTCRPEYTNEAKRIFSKNGKNIDVLYVKGFSTPQQKEYITKLLSVVEENTCKREEMIQELFSHLQTLEHKLYSLLNLPLTMMLMTLLWIQDKTSFTGAVTNTHILKQSVELGIRRLVEHLNKRAEETRHVMLIEQACRQWLRCLAEVAWEALHDNTQILNDDRWNTKLLSEAKCLDLDPIYALSSFLICTSRENAFGSQLIWEFPHKAYQEYLSGYYLSEEQVPHEKQIPRIIFEPQGSSFPRILEPQANFRSRNFSKISLSRDYNPSPVKSRAPRLRGCSLKLRCIWAPFINAKCLSSSQDVLNSDITSEVSRGVTVNNSVNSSIYDTSNNISEEEYTMNDMNVNFLQESKIKQALFCLIAIEISKEPCDINRIANIVERIDLNIMFDPLVDWSRIVRECAENEVVCRLVRPYLQKHNTIQLSGYQISQTLPAVKYLMETTGFVPESLSVSLSNDDTFSDILPSLLASLATLSVYTSIECPLHHCLNLYQCLTQQETLDYIHIILNLDSDIIMHDSNTGELSEFVQLLQYLEEKHSKLRLNLTVNDIQSAESFAKCFANITMPKSVELSILFLCFTPLLDQSLQKIFKAFPWQRPLSISFSHTALGNDTVHLLKLVSQALTDAQVKVLHTSLNLELYSKSLTGLYEEMAYIIARDAPLNINIHERADRESITFTIEGNRFGQD